MDDSFNQDTEFRFSNTQSYLCSASQTCMCPLAWNSVECKIYQFNLLFKCMKKDTFQVTRITFLAAWISANQGYYNVF